jgi:hypothetical protein
MLILTSKKTYELTTALKKKIFILKKEVWNYSLKNQNKWFSNNVYPNDLHNLVFFKKELIGYTLLRKRSLKTKNLKTKYIYFDTFLVKKKYRKLGIGRILMNFNKFYIKKTKLISVLLCYKKTVGFYRKFNWNNISNNNVCFVDKPKKRCLYFMFLGKIKKKKFLLFLKK